MVEASFPGLIDCVHEGLNLLLDSTSYSPNYWVNEGLIDLLTRRKNVFREDWLHGLGHIIGLQVKKLWWLYFILQIRVEKKYVSNVFVCVNHLLYDTLTEFKSQLQDWLTEFMKDCQNVKLSAWIHPIIKSRAGIGLQINKTCFVLSKKVQSSSRWTVVILRF